MYVSRKNEEAGLLLIARPNSRASSVEKSRVAVRPERSRPSSTGKLRPSFSGFGKENQTQQGSSNEDELAKAEKRRAELKQWREQHAVSATRRASGAAAEAPSASQHVSGWTTGAAAEKSSNSFRQGSAAKLRRTPASTPQAGQSLRVCMPGTTSGDQVVGTPLAMLPGVPQPNPATKLRPLVKQWQEQHSAVRPAAALPPEGLQKASAARVVRSGHSGSEAAGREVALSRAPSAATAEQPRSLPAADEEDLLWRLQLESWRQMQLKFQAAALDESLKKATAQAELELAGAAEQAKALQRELEQSQLRLQRLQLGRQVEDAVLRQLPHQHRWHDLQEAHGEAIQQLHSELSSALLEGPQASSAGTGPAPASGATGLVEDLRRVCTAAAQIQQGAQGGQGGPSAEGASLLAPAQSATELLGVCEALQSVFEANASLVGEAAREMLTVQSYFAHSVQTQRSVAL